MAGNAFGVSDTVKNRDFRTGLQKTVVSERIQVLRFPLILGIVFIHSYAAVPLSLNVGASSGMTWVESFRLAISHGAAWISIPCFLAISGYLFFLNFEGDGVSYVKKLKSRFRTLAIPFLFWGHFVLLCYLVFQELPLTQDLFTGNRGRVSEFSFYDYLNALLGLDYRPFAFQFWFIRDLIVLTFLSPVFYFFGKRVPLLTGLFLAGCYFFPEVWPVRFLEARSVFFFFVGAWCAISGRSLFFLDRFGIPAAALYAVFWVLDILTKTRSCNGIIHDVGMCVGMVAVLSLSGKVVTVSRFGALKKCLLTLSSGSFFLFATHEPLMSFIGRVICRKLDNSSPLSFLLAYLLIPSFLVFFLMATYFILRKIVPRPLAFVTGGR